jgi:hypothetical protein
MKSLPYRVTKHSAGRVGFGPIRWNGPLAPAVWLLAFLFFARVCVAAEAQVHLLALGDWGAGTPAQSAVAAAMKTYVEAHNLELDAVLLLGDNFYVKLDGVHDADWKKLFEEMYDPRRLAAPFYAVLGNHDHNNNRAQVEFDYARQNPRSRFKLPHHWYRVDLPTNQPLVTLIALDSTADKLSKEQWAAQKRWVETELAKPRAASWTICFGHHPLFSDSVHGDATKLQKDWGPAFKRHKIDFYLAGHDHVLEHLEIPNWPASFIISGGGGYETYEIERQDRAKFARSIHGFVHLQFTTGRARVSFIDKDGNQLHVFERQSRDMITDVPRAPSTRSLPDSAPDRAERSQAPIYEAENAKLSGAMVGRAHAGYSGNGFVDFVNDTGDYIEWTVHAPSAGTHTLEFRYAQVEDNDRPLELRVNGKVVHRRLSFPAAGNDWEFVQHEVKLVAGENTIRLIAIGANGPNLDYLRVEQAKARAAMRKPNSSSFSSFALDSAAFDSNCSNRLFKSALNERVASP